MANPSLDFDAISSYSLTIECTDGTDNATAYLTVDVIPNAAPTFLNLPSKCRISSIVLQCKELVGIDYCFIFIEHSAYSKYIGLMCC